MQIEFTLAEDDLRAFIRHVVWKSRASWIRIGICTAFVAFGGWLLYEGTRPITGLFIAWIGIASYLNMALVDVFRVRQLRKARDTRLVLGQLRITLSPEGVSQSSAFGTSHYFWRAVEAITEGKQHAFLMLSAARAFIIPRRAFATEAEYIRFVETAKRLKRESEVVPTSAP